MANTKPTMLTYIEETPMQLELNNNNSKELTKELVNLYLQKKYKTIWIIASGSSSNASNCAKPFMMKYLDCNVEIVPPNTFLYSDLTYTDDDFIFVISQSGCSTNSIDALKKLKSINKTAIGITGNVNSDFKDYADVVIDYGVGVETVGYVTKGVTTLAQFLMLFALEASGTEFIEELNDVPNRHKIIQEETNAFYEKNKALLTSMTVSYACGFMQGYGIATEAALKIGETVQIPSFAYEAEEFIHGPNLQLTPNYTLFFIDDLYKGSKRLEQIYLASRSVTDRCFAITNSDIVDDNHAIRLPFEIKEPLLSPLYLLPFFQILAFRITTDLNKWHRHPLFKDFEKLVSCKTEKIKEIMPNS